MEWIGKIKDIIDLAIKIKEVIGLILTLTGIKITSIKFSIVNEYFWQIISAALLFSTLYFMFKFFSIKGIFGHFKVLESIKKLDRIEIVLLSLFVSPRRNALKLPFTYIGIESLVNLGILEQFGDVDHRFIEDTVNFRITKQAREYLTESWYENIKSKMSKDELNLLEHERVNARDFIKNYPPKKQYIDTWNESKGAMNNL
ncbi:MAG: hypothetical protein FWB90_00770 [Fibromonadales bacterium]|nr:hypothetical protein [Fibromonadales bacterium]